MARLTEFDGVLEGRCKVRGHQGRRHINPKGLRRIAIWCVAACIFGFQAHPAIAGPMTEQEYRNIFLQTFSYHVVARVCNDTAAIEKSAKTLRRVLNFGTHNNILSYEAKAYMAYPKEFIAKGEDQYRKDRYVGCAQGKHEVDVLDNATKQLP